MWSVLCTKWCVKMSVSIRAAFILKLLFVDLKNFWKLKFMFRKCNYVLGLERWFSSPTFYLTFPIWRVTSCLLLNSFGVLHVLHWTTFSYQSQSPRLSWLAHKCSAETQDSLINMATVSSSPCHAGFLSRRLWEDPLATSKLFPLFYKWSIL